MPSKTVKKTTPPAEVPVQSAAAEPVATSPVVAAVETQQPKQKGGKKAVAKVAEPVTTTSPVVEAVPAPKKGGAKSKVPVETSTPVVVETTPEPKKKAPRTAKAPKAAKPVQEAGAAAEGQTAGAPKVKAPRKQAVKKEKAPKVAATTVETENDDSSDRRVRSFKVKLPDKEEFEGRFTGLTPYQAANKALSKYFRETEKPKQEITFLICESTRKSKKSVYTYVGKRYQLEVPVKYTIQDGREIVKNFKNSLKKVKKVDLVDQSGGATPAAVAPATA